MMVSADCERCRKLAAQAAYILVPTSRMSTGPGILFSYLGLCWCNFTKNPSQTLSGKSFRGLQKPKEHTSESTDQVRE